MAFDIRQITEAESEPFFRQLSRAFLGDYRPDDAEPRRQTQEFDRSLATFDGDELVGTAGIFSFEMTTPGGRLPTAGVTQVSVKATHRRKGVLSGMMRRQLLDIRDRGEALAALWASESIIYGRFGYGLGIDSVELSIDNDRTAFRAMPTVAGHVRLVNVDEAREQYPATWDAVRLSQPGMVSRSPAFWNHRVWSDPEHWRDGFSEAHNASYEVDGQVQGYVRYRTKSRWDDDHLPNGILSVQELIATTDEAYVALWNYVFGVDLVGVIKADNRKPDEPLFWMLADPRRLRRKSVDSIWLRIVDVARALQGRRYSLDGRLAIAVEDDFLPDIAGTYVLEGGPDGAKCTRETTTPDITLGVRDLAAAYMGGTGFGTLARAGRVHGSLEAIRKATLMFSWDPSPWCPEHF